MAACDLSQLIDDASCLNCLSGPEKRAAFLYYMAQAVVGAGGTDYTDVNTLREAVACWCVGGAVVESFKTRTAINAAVNSGQLEAAPSIATIRDAIKCWNCGIGADEMKKMEAFLLCAFADVVFV